MSGAEYELVARVGKAHGLEGEVTATAVGDLPFCLYEGLHVHVVPPSLYGARELTVAQVEEGTGSTYRVIFEEIASIDAAEQLAGRFLLADIRDLEDMYFDDPLFDIGRTVIDERYGELGAVVEIIQTPANDVWVVQGEHGEILVPIIDEVVVEYPQEHDAPIGTHIMDGLIDA